MKNARVTDLRDHLSRYLAYVRGGGVVRVFDRDRPIADLVPVGRAVSRGGAPIESILADLERKGIVRRGGGRLPREFLTRGLPRPRRSVLDALIEERREGR